MEWSNFFFTHPADSFFSVCSLPIFNACFSLLSCRITVSFHTVKLEEEIATIPTSTLSFPWKKKSMDGKYREKMQSQTKPHHRIWALHSEEHMIIRGRNIQFPRGETHTRVPTFKTYRTVRFSVQISWPFLPLKEGSTSSSENPTESTTPRQPDRTEQQSNLWGKFHWPCSSPLAVSQSTDVGVVSSLAFDPNSEPHDRKCNEISTKSSGGWKASECIIELDYFSSSWSFSRLKVFFSRFPRLESVFRS